MARNIESLINSNIDSHTDIPVLHPEVPAALRPIEAALSSVDVLHAACCDSHK